MTLRFRLAGGGRPAGVWVHLAFITLGLQVPRAESSFQVIDIGGEGVSEA